jgi:hypothetical protein
MIDIVGGLRAVYLSSNPAIWSRSFRSGQPRSLLFPILFRRLSAVSWRYCGGWSGSAIGMLRTGWDILYYLEMLRLSEKLPDALSKSKTISILGFVRNVACCSASERWVWSRWIRLGTRFLLLVHSFVRLRTGALVRVSLDLFESVCLHCFMAVGCSNRQTSIFLLVRRRLGRLR